MEVTLLHKKSQQLHQITCNDEDELYDLISALFGLSPDKISLKLNGKVFVFKNVKTGDVITIEDEEITHFENTMKEVKEMIYISGKYGDYSFRIFIDSGAQSNIMSYEMATFLNIDNLIDKRHKGVAFGVGKQTIHGCIFNCKINIDDKISVPINFKIMDVEADKYLVILGLEFLYAYDCMLNFKSKRLVIGDHIINFITNSVPYPINYRKEKLKQQYKIISDNKIATDLIKKIIENLIKNPNDDKYKKINTNSKLFNNNKICLEFLIDIGFKYIDDSNLFYKESINTLNYVMETLRQ